MPADWTEHGDGVFARRYRSLDLNVGVVVGEGGLVVIDSRANHHQGRELARHLEVFRRAVRSTPQAPSSGASLRAPPSGASEAQPPASTARARPVTMTPSEAMRAMLKEMAPDQAEAFDEVVITPPEFTFTSEVSVTFGGRHLVMRHLGRGHTDNDIVVSVPDAGVVFAGDLIEQGAPPAYNDAFPLEWPDTDAALLEMVGGVVVPGHGAAVDAAFVATQQEEIAEVARLARERHSEGMTAGSAARRGGPYPEEVMEVAFTRAWEALS